MFDARTPFALVADDDAFIRADAAGILETAGFRIYEAADAESAIEILQRNAEHIQLLFSDVQMPPGELDGFDLARLCAERWPHIGILVASGQIEPEPGQLPEGAIFIGKPFCAEVVHARIQELLPAEMKPEPLKEAFSGSMSGVTSSSS